MAFQHGRIAIVTDPNYGQLSARLLNTMLPMLPPASMQLNAPWIFPDPRRVPLAVLIARSVMLSND